jgi:glycerol uptake facilitator-like aquaporin
MTTPAGWYPDPAGSTQLRYFDGVTWTEHLAPAVATPGPHTSARTPMSKRNQRILFAILGAIVGLAVALALGTGHHDSSQRGTRSTITTGWSPLLVAADGPRG